MALPPTLASQLDRQRAARGGSAALLAVVLEVRPLVQRAGLSIPGSEASYCAWGGATCAPGTLGVPAGLLPGLGLAEGRPVAVRPLWEVPAAEWVSVEPASEDDWEIVELNAEYLEGQLLTQAC